VTLFIYQYFFGNLYDSLRFVQSFNIRLLVVLVGDLVHFSKICHLYHLVKCCFTAQYANIISYLLCIPFWNLVEAGWI